MARTIHYDGGQPFIADPASITRDPGRQVDWRYVGDAYRLSAATVQMNGTAGSGATVLTVDALPIDLYPGQLLYFGQSQEFARVTAPASEGGTVVSVEALPQALENDDTAVVGGEGTKTIKPGTVMCELSSGKVVPRAIRPGSETSIGLLASQATEDDQSAALTGYGLIVGGVIYENLLPDAAGTTIISSTYKSEMGSAGITTGFSWKQYADDRGA